MGNKPDATNRCEEEYEFEEIWAEEEGGGNRTLILRKEPRPRKIQLMNAGVKEIRCFCCMRIKPIAESEECDEGWVCEDCLSDAAGQKRHVG